MKLKKSTIKSILNEFNIQSGVKVVEKECSYTRFIFNRDKHDWLFKEIESILPGKYKLKNHFRGCMYEPGDFMDPHTDGDYAYADMSGGIQLNNEYSGGEFIIDSKKLEAEIGELFMFGRSTIHNINKVKEGIRYSLHFHIMDSTISRQLI